MLNHQSMDICQLQGLGLQLRLGWLGQCQTAKDHSSLLMGEGRIIEGRSRALVLS